MGIAGDSLHYAFPPRSGGRSPHGVDPLDGRERSGPWIRWLLLLFLIISLKIIIVEPGGPRRVTLARVRCTFLQKVSLKPKQNHWPPTGVFCCCGLFFVTFVQGFSLVPHEEFVILLKNVIFIQGFSLLSEDASC